MSENFCVYKLTSPSGKVYIGKTGDFEKRMREHNHLSAYRRASNTALGNAIRKYGWENFIKEVVYSGLTEEEAFYYEVLLIQKYNCRSPRGYNLTNGGEGSAGYTHRVESLEKMRAAQKSVWSDPEARARRIESAHRPEMKARRSAGIIAANAKPEVKIKRSLAMKKIMTDPETLARYIATLKDTLSDAEVQARRVDALREAVRAPEARLKKSAVMKTLMENPKERARAAATLKATLSDAEVQARRIAGIIAANAKPEVKARYSASRKASWARRKAEAEAKFNSLPLAEQESILAAKREHRREVLRRAKTRYMEKKKAEREAAEVDKLITDGV